jgi:hypothetical protein
MQTYRISFILLLFLCVSFNFSAFSQSKTYSLKFDEYDEANGENLSLLAEKTKRFAKHLQNLPKETKGVIIYYLDATKVDFCSDRKSAAEERNDYVRELLIEKYKISPERIVSKFSAYRGSTELEFWIQSKDARFPIATPNMFVDCFCPTITVKGSEIFSDKTKPLIFNAFVSGFVDEKVSYKWKISAGEIIEGQGTSEIKVDASKINAEEITATFQIIGMCCSFCIDTDAFTTKIQN